MLVFHWLSLKLFPRRAAQDVETQIKQLEANLSALSSLGALGRIPSAAKAPFKNVVALVDGIRSQLGEIDSDPVLASSIEKSKMPKLAPRRRRKSSAPIEPTAIVIARRLLAQGVAPEKAAKKTLLHEETVRRLLPPAVAEVAGVAEVVTVAVTIPQPSVPLVTEALFNPESFIERMQVAL